MGRGGGVNKIVMTWYEISILWHEVMVSHKSTIGLCIYKIINNGLPLHKGFVRLLYVVIWYYYRIDIYMKFKPLDNQSIGFYYDLLRHIISRYERCIKIKILLYIVFVVLETLQYLQWSKLYKKTNYNYRF